MYLFEKNTYLNMIYHNMIYHSNKEIFNINRNIFKYYIMITL